jgi:hypothetical protein
MYKNTEYNRFDAILMLGQMQTRSQQFMWQHSRTPHIQHQFDSITNIPGKNLWISVTYSNTVWPNNIRNSKPVRHKNEGHNWKFNTGYNTRILAFWDVTCRWINESQRFELINLVDLRR